MHAHENPFRSTRAEALAFRAEGVEPDRLLARWRALGRRGALVGPRGSGKTTLLEELARRLARSGRAVRLVRVPARSAELPELLAVVRAAAAAGETLALDCAGRLGPVTGRVVVRAARAAHGLLLTAHRPGFAPTLHEHRTDARLLRDLVAELVSPDEMRELELSLPALLERREGDVRACLRELYDRWAERPAREPRSDARQPESLLG